MPVGAPLAYSTLSALVAFTYTQSIETTPETKMVFLAVPLAIEPAGRHS